jgi:hypothetical protein
MMSRQASTVQAPLSNYAVNPPHSAVTALAVRKRRAVGRAGYRER